ncbi:MAG TPA: ankyrin repeat domain-containing protein [Thermoanaerobaculia bacterium]
MAMRRLAVLILSIIVSTACPLAPSSPAVAAASRGDVAAMKSLLDTGLDPNARDATGYTPLISAARAGNVSMIRLLTSRGADPNLRDAAVNSWTPLLHAVHKGQPRSIAALLDAGADANRTDSYGTTPLMMAAGYGYTGMVRILLSRGANPRLPMRDGVTAIDLARTGVPDIDRFTVFDCQDDTVKALLAADPNLPDHTGNLPPIARLLMKTKRCGA